MFYNQLTYTSHLGSFGISMDGVITRQRDIYQSRFNEFGDRPVGFHWRDKKTRDLRFERLIAHLHLQDGFSMYDVGCGTGEFHKYLTNSGYKHSYTGCEIVPEMCARAQELYPDQSFEIRNILQDVLTDSHDHVVASGVFFIRGDDDMSIWKSHVFSMIDAMYAISRRSISFNVLGNWSDWQDDQLAYFDMNELRTHCEKLTRFMHFDFSYPLYEGTVSLYKPQAIQALYSSPEYERYFISQEG